MIVAIIAGLAVVVLITAACVKVSARWSRWEEQQDNADCNAKD